jgi:uncharacterized protein (TIGR02594 family)
MTTAYDLARADIGTVEWRNGNNPKVLAYFADTGNAWVKDDETAWCAAFVGSMLHRAGQKGTGKLNARSYLDWGVPVDLQDALPGDVVVFKRGNSTWQGHVAFFVRRSGAFVTVLGGNQSDQVKESNYPVASILGIRRLAVSDPVEPPAVPAPVTRSFWAALATTLAGIWRGQ